MARRNRDPLKTMRGQLKTLIEKSYECVDDFCTDRRVNRATVSNFLRSKKDFQISTLCKIADALDRQLVVKLA